MSKCRCGLEKSPVCAEPFNPGNSAFPRICGNRVRGKYCCHKESCHAALGSPLPQPPSEPELEHRGAMQNLFNLMASHGLILVNDELLEIVRAAKEIPDTSEPRDEPSDFKLREMYKNLPLFDQADSHVHVTGFDIFKTGYHLARRGK